MVQNLSDDISDNTYIFIERINNARNINLLFCSFLKMINIGIVYRLPLFFDTSYIK